MSKRCTCIAWDCQGDERRLFCKLDEVIGTPPACGKHPLENFFDCPHC